ncbi:MAG: cysteine protease StiP family protein [Gammaproteobacteria bacterium]|nr:cysteine protease StiP family protein [Gammaproteobacteria bacterium]
MTKKFHGSYLPDDVIFLLKPIAIGYTDVAEKEHLIQTQARHYSEMLSREYSPSEQYLAVFHTAFAQNKRKLAQHLLALAKHLSQKAHITLVSLARAGTPIGVLLKRTLRDIFKKEVTHYSISIIRDRGIDENALRYILNQNKNKGKDIVFIDGWTGKGVIARELRKWTTAFNEVMNTHISPDLYVIADISGSAAVAAALEDYLIPSSLLNAAISGLVSRSILNDTYIGPEDFHGCKFHAELREHDLSLWYIEQIMAEIEQINTAGDDIAACADMSGQARREQAGIAFIQGLMQRYRVEHINYIKPGLGEAIRVLLRRVPERILVRDKNLPEITPFLVLADEKKVPVNEVPDMPYKAAGIISSVR